MRLRPGDLIEVEIKQRGGDTQVVDAALADVEELLILARGGDDFIAVAHTLSLNTMLDGGEGNDMACGGAVRDKIFGRVQRT